MSARRRLVLELDPDQKGPVGALRDERDVEIPFAGWLAFASALDQALNMPPARAGRADAGGPTRRRLRDDLVHGGASDYFSVVQRKVLQPNDFEDLAALEQRLLAFGRHYEQIATPFEWKLTRRDLDRPLTRLDYTAERRVGLRAADRDAIRQDGQTSKNLAATGPGRQHRPPKRRVFATGPLRRPSEPTRPRAEHLVLRSARIWMTLRSDLLTAGTMTRRLLRLGERPRARALTWLPRRTNCGHRTTETDRTAGFRRQAKACSRCGFGFLFELLDDYYPAPDTAFLVCDSEGRVIGCGRGSFERTGLDDERVIGRQVRDVRPALRERRRSRGHRARVGVRALNKPVSSTPRAICPPLRRPTSFPPTMTTAACCWS